ncbi:class F sortase [Actinomycetospora chlora]|uniref:Class F sortase n=1 Tax=Actinomycetospora chlora TaxID=663608 RepID=A0ABP9ALJ6_9PSEU
MSRHRRPPRPRPAHPAPTALDPVVLGRVLAVLAVVLSAACTAMGVATASRPPDPCPPVAAPWYADPTPLPRAEPVSLTVDRVDACSSLVPVDRLAAPAAPEQAGWFRDGPTPGEAGSAVVVGQVEGGGRRRVFAGLAAATAGDRVTVWRRDGSLAVFTVEGTTQVSATSFPTRTMHARSPDALLRLLAPGTDGADDVIVYARLVGRG